MLEWVPDLGSERSRFKTFPYITLYLEVTFTNTLNIFLYQYNNNNTDIESQCEDKGVQ